MKSVNNLSYNSYLTIQVNEYFLNELKSMFNNKLMITKDELSEVLNLSSRTISNKMSNGTLNIKFIKLGNSMQSAVMFPIIAVAEYLTKEMQEEKTLIAS
ncbi:MAG: hypothetical protein Q9M32_06240 [Sulfurimonas sp.]|nr:hypothetical protein [Sulfurimonas sp.]